MTYFFSELLFLPGVLQVGSGILGFSVAFLLPRCKLLEVVGSSLTGLVIATLSVFILFPFNHHGDRSLFVSFMVVNWFFFLVGAAIFMWLANRRSRGVGP